MEATGKTLEAMAKLDSNDPLMNWLRTLEGTLLLPLLMADGQAQVNAAPRHADRHHQSSTT
eukprot:1162118-Pelagomonas_calceolata.AAC.1